MAKKKEAKKQVKHANKAMHKTAAKHAAKHVVKHEHAAKHASAKHVAKKQAKRVARRIAKEQKKAKQTVRHASKNVSSKKRQLKHDEKRLKQAGKARKGIRNMIGLSSNGVSALHKNQKRRNRLKEKIASDKQRLSDAKVAQLGSIAKQAAVQRRTSKSRTKVDKQAAIEREAAGRKLTRDYSKSRKRQLKKAEKQLKQAKNEQTAEQTHLVSLSPGFGRVFGTTADAKQLRSAHHRIVKAEKKIKALKRHPSKEQLAREAVKKTDHKLKEARQQEKLDKSAMKATHGTRVGTKSGSRSLKQDIAYQRSVIAANKERAQAYRDVASDGKFSEKAANRRLGKIDKADAKKEALSNAADKRNKVAKKLEKADLKHDAKEAKRYDKKAAASKSQASRSGKMAATTNFMSHIAGMSLVGRFAGHEFRKHSPFTNKYNQSLNKYHYYKSEANTYKEMMKKKSRPSKKALATQALNKLASAKHSKVKAEKKLKKSGLSKKKRDALKKRIAKDRHEIKIGDKNKAVYEDIASGGKLSKKAIDRKFAKAKSAKKSAKGKKHAVKKSTKSKKHAVKKHAVKQTRAKGKHVKTRKHAAAKKVRTRKTVKTVKAVKPVHASHTSYSTKLSAPVRHVSIPHMVRRTAAPARTASVSAPVRTASVGRTSRPHVRTASIGGSSPFVHTHASASPITHGASRVRTSAPATVKTSGSVSKPVSRQVVSASPSHSYSSSTGAKTTSSSPFVHEDEPSESASTYTAPQTAATSAENYGDDNYQPTQASYGANYNANSYHPLAEISASNGYYAYPAAEIDEPNYAADLQNMQQYQPDEIILASSMPQNIQIENQGQSTLPLIDTASVDPALATANQQQGMQNSSDLSY